MNSWLLVERGNAPVIFSLPHTGIFIPPAIEKRLVSPWLARKDTDWWIEKLYDFASAFEITCVRTTISRTVIDVNRDPSGASLYPGQATTELCPLTSFDGERLYVTGQEPDDNEISSRKHDYFDPYHDAVTQEIARLKSRHRNILLYDAHSIRSTIPRLFEGTLPHLNIGTNSGRTAHPSFSDTMERACACSEFSFVTNGRFRGGWITRRYGDPARGVHAVQMELACRGYMTEPKKVEINNWPPVYDDGRAAELRAVLIDILKSCLALVKDLKS